MEKNFAKDVFNVLCCVKRNIDWSAGGKPPIDRHSYELLMECYDFEPLQKHWSRRKTITIVGYRSTIDFYFKTVNQESQTQMRHQIDRDDELTYTKRIG